MEPHVVQINSLGNYTLSHQKVFSANIDYYAAYTDATDVQLVDLLGQLDQENIVKKFTKKPNVRPVEYFKKQFNEDVLKKFIRPFIEKTLNEAILLMEGKEIFLMSKDGKNPAWQKVEMTTEKSTVLFHFRKKEDGTRYFPTIRYQGEKVDFKEKGGFLLTNQPAWLVVNNKLYNFEKAVDGNKLKPFLNKKYIHIPKASEKVYFEKFVVPLVEKFDVYAKGFDIVTETLPAVPVITIDDAWGDEIRLNLSFMYGDSLYPYHSTKKVSVFLEKQDDQYIFKRLRRSKAWEESKKDLMLHLGLTLLQGSSFVKKGEGGKLGIIEWLNNHHNLLKEDGFLVKQPGNDKYFVGERKITLVVDEQLDWFDVRATVVFGDYTLPFAQLRRYIVEGTREFLLPSGETGVIPEEWFTKYLELIELSTEQKSIKLHRHHWKLLQDLQLTDEERAMQNKLENLKNWSGDTQPVKLPENFNGQLRPYQEEGYQWFYFLQQNGFGGCLADDMGLGKTIQALALLASEKERHSTVAEEEVEVTDFAYGDMAGNTQVSIFDTPVMEVTKKVKIKKKAAVTSLVIAPTSLIYNWVSEAQKFAPDLKILLHTGTSRNKNISKFDRYDIVIATYGVVRLDISLLRTFPFHYLILDESQAIKNPGSLTYKSVKELTATNRLVLTGTPIENTITDLWSQMNFVNPGLLGNYNYFQQRFVVPIEKEGNESRRQKLQELISPFILRRTKKQVAKDLPDKYEFVHYCEMTEEQEKIYEETKSYFRNKILESVSQIGLNRSKLQILKGLVMMRQIANHPRLSNPDFTGESGKFTEITRMLETAISEGHKVLIFSQFVKQLAIFRQYFDERKQSYCYLDGTTPAKKRQEEVKLFQKDEQIKVFLISLKAGGTGLNLTAADYVFMVDPWWNPAVEKQAIDRTHRIGQQQKVFSYKFITKNSVEEKILLLQNKKQKLAEDIITTENSLLNQLDLVEIEELLQ